MLLALAGCNDFRFEGFLGRDRPIPLILDQDILFADVSFRDQPPVRVALDTASPITTVAPETAGSSAVSGRTRGDLRVYRGGDTSVTRFIFRNVEIYELPVEPVGLDQSIAIDGLLGVDLLSRFAVHLRWHPTTVTDAGSSAALGSLALSPDIPDDTQSLAEECNLGDLLEDGGFARQRCLAVLRTPRLGGSISAIAGEERALPPTRIALPLCLMPASFDAVAAGSAQQAPTETVGVSALGVVSTGLGISVISRSLFDRLKLAHPELTEEASSPLLLPSGPQPVSLTSIPRSAVVSSETRDLGPCGELARRRRLLVTPVDALPATDRNQRGAAFAFVELPVTFAIVDDEAPLIQGLRQELRPVAPDVDVVLGGDWLRNFDIDLDYPAGRTLLQCAPSTAGTSCQTVPYCRQDQSPRCMESS